MANIKTLVMTDLAKVDLLIMVILRVE